MLKGKQQQFLVALLEEDTIEKAYNRASISRATAYKYLSDPVFKQQLSEQRRNLMTALIQKLQNNGESAVDALVNNLNDPEATVSSRNHTAKIILDYVFKGHELEQIIERLDEIEKRLES